jgi:O-antigen ligase
MTTNIVTGIIIMAVLLFGAVDIWSGIVTLVLVFTIGLVWILRREYNSYQTTDSDKLLLAAGASFIVYTLIQAMPLPSFLLKLISASTFEMHSYYSVEIGNSAQISLYPYKSFLESLELFALFTVFAIAVHNFKDRENLIRALHILVIFGFCLAIFAVIQKALWNEKIYWFRELTLGGTPFGPFVNRNHYAGFIGMLIPLGLGLCLTSETRAKKILFGFMTVIMAVSLFFSLSRGGIISFLAGMGLFSFLIMKSRIQQRKILSIAIFLIVLSAYLLYLGIDPVIDRFYKTDISKLARLKVWSATIDAIKDFWFMGTGLGTFIHVFPLYEPVEIHSIFDHAHNDYLELILETGLVGTIMTITFIAIMIKTIVKSSLRGRTGILLIAAVSSAGTMFVHSLSDFNLHILSNALCFSLVLGIVTALADVNVERRKQNQNNSKD